MELSGRNGSRQNGIQKVGKMALSRRNWSRQNGIK